MSPYNDPQPHLVIKSESPPLQSVPISSTGQSHAQHPDSVPHFRFGTKEQNALPPFSFISRSGSSPSSLPQHTSMSHLTSYSSSQSHFPVPSMDDPGALTPTDEYDDGDETGDFPSASSSKMLDKAVRRRSSKGASRFVVPLRLITLSMVFEPSLRPMS
jgi:hypothetical protein